MMCVYCGQEKSLFIVDNEAESVGCWSHIGNVIEDRMTLDASAQVRVERVK